MKQLIKQNKILPQQLAFGAHIVGFFTLILNLLLIHQRTMKQLIRTKVSKGFLVVPLLGLLALAVVLVQVPGVLAAWDSNTSAEYAINISDKVKANAQFAPISIQAVNVGAGGDTLTDVNLTITGNSGFVTSDLSSLNGNADGTSGIQFYLDNGTVGTFEPGTDAQFTLSPAPTFVGSGPWTVTLSPNATLPSAATRNYLIVFDIAGSPTDTHEFRVTLDSVTYSTAGSKTDLATSWPSASTYGTIDTTVPTFSTRQTQDLDADGKLDAVKVTISESVDDSTLAIADFATSHATGLDTTFTGSFGGLTFTNGIATVTANDAVFYLKLVETAGTCSSSDASGCDTDATPTVTHTAGGITDHAGGALATTGAVAATDLAAPIPMYAKYKDVTSANGQVDRVDITFSENIVDDTYNDADYTIAEAGTIVLANETGVTASGDDLQVAALGSANITGGATNPQITYTNNFAEGTRGLNDAAGNAVATFTVTATDAAAPRAVSSQYLDSDLNGAIDRVEITMTENVTLDEYDDTDWAVTVAGNVNLLDDTAVAIVSSNIVRITTAGDAGKTGKDAGADPTFTYTAANGTAGSLNDGTNAAVDLTFATISDGAVPQILSSTGLDSDNDGKTNSYTITFSENLTDKGAAASNANFTARNAVTTSAITISTVGIGVTAGGGAAKVTLNLDDADTDNYTGSVEFTYNSAGGGAVIEDAATGTNDFANVSNSALTDDVAPVMLLARAANVGGTADVLNAATEFLEFTFSEPMNATPPSLANLEAGLTFANGAVDGDNNLGGGTNTVTRTTRTMANDSYRVTHVDTDSASLITPATDTAQVTTGTNIVDLASVAANTNPVAVTITSADIVSPTFSTRQTQDLDGDGKIDAIKVTMSESIVDSTLDAADFAMGSSYVIASINGDTSEAGDDANDDIFYLILTETAGTCSSSDATGCDTDAVPTVTYTEDTLADASGNLATTTLAIASTDLAAPVPMYGKYKDVTVVNGAIDRVDITFSEAILSDGYTDGDYTVAVAGTVIALADETAIATSGDDLRMTSAGAANKTGGGTAPQVTYTAAFVDTTNGLNDAAGNAVATFTVTLTDSAAPFYLSSVTLDNNNDGTVDFVKVTYTESVLDSSVAATDFETGVADTTAGNLTESFTSLTPSSGNATDVADDEIIYVGIASSGETIAAKDTDYTIKVEQVAAVTDAGANSYASFGSQTSTDGAKPVIATVTIEDAASGDGLIDKVTFTWSENIDTDNGDAPVAADLPTTLLPDGSTADFSGAAISDPAGASAAVVVTTVAGQATANTAAGSTAISGDLSAKWVDGAANAPHATGATGNEAITDSAKPVFKTSTTADTDLNGTVDQITIVYSETVAITDAGDGFDGVAFANSCSASNADNTSAGTTTSVITVSGCTAGDTTITASPTYTAATGQIVDLASSPNEMADAETVTGTDGAAPAVTALTVNDADADGDMDTVALTYSENLTNTAAAANGFDVTSAANHGTCNTESADPAASTALTLTFACSTANTAVADLTIAFTANAGLQDSSGNQVGTKTYSTGSSPAITDIAAPVPMTASITKAISNYNLQISSVITVTFSEPVTGTGVANSDWKFSRNGSEALATGNWPDGATVGYGGSSTTITMTLSAATTGGAWTSGAMLNMAGNNTASIVDAVANQADLKATNITISGLIGPALDAIAVTANTGTAATIGWISSSATTSNSVNYGTTTAVASSSTAGSPGEGSTSHSVNLTGLTVGTLYYYQVCSTNVSQTCSAISSFTSAGSSDVTGPTISSQTPTDNATSQAITVAPTLTFSEALDPATVNSANIQLRLYSDDTQVAADILYNPSTFVVTTDPQASLSYSTQYYLYASTSVHDAAGNALTTDYTATTKASHEFTTVANSSDVTAPTISSQTPADNATGVAITVAPTLTFSEAMDASTLNGGTIQLRKYSDNTAVAASLLYNPSTFVVTITPTASLTNSTQYYLFVSGAKDAAGNTESTDYTATTKASHEFTTTAESVTLAVTQIASTNSTMTADATYANGGSWTFSITVPTSETNLQLKFDDWVSGSNSIATANNMRIYSAQSSNASVVGSAITITAADTYSTALALTGDLDSSTAGLQIQVVVDLKVPLLTAGGSYTTTYSALSAAP